MDRNLIKRFWHCGDSGIIEYAVDRARLNRNEKECIRMLLDECFTQEEAAEQLNLSVRELQKRWYSAADKLLSLPWLVAYSETLRHR